MIVVNKLATLGGIRRVDLTPDMVYVFTTDNRELSYKLIPVGEKYSYTPVAEDKLG